MATCCCTAQKTASAAQQKYTKVYLFGWKKIGQFPHFLQWSDRGVLAPYASARISSFFCLLEWRFQIRVSVFFFRSSNIHFFTRFQFKTRFLTRFHRTKYFNVVFFGLAILSRSSNDFKLFDFYLWFTLHFPFGGVVNKCPHPPADDRKSRKEKHGHTY